jgi:hypothetical protein
MRADIETTNLQGGNQQFILDRAVGDNKIQSSSYTNGSLEKKYEGLGQKNV